MPGTIPVESSVGRGGSEGTVGVGRGATCGTGTGPGLGGVTDPLEPQKVVVVQSHGTSSSCSQGAL